MFIPNAVPNYTPTNRTDAIARFGLEPKKYLLMVTRLIQHKGAHHLIEAYNKMRRENLNMTMPKLVIVGDGHHTDKYVRGLMALAADNPDIIFTGAQSGIPLAEFFSHAMALIHPSDKEGLPITVLEGMSYGLPVLVSDIPEHLHLIPHAPFVFARGNVIALADRLSWLITQSETMLKQVGDDNRRRVLRDYDWDTAVNQIMVAYHTARYKPEANAAMSSLPSKFTSSAATSTPGVSSDV